MIAPSKHRLKGYILLYFFARKCQNRRFLYLGLGQVGTSRTNGDEKQHERLIKVKVFARKWRFLRFYLFEVVRG